MRNLLVGVVLGVGSIGGVLAQDAVVQGLTFTVWTDHDYDLVPGKLYGTVALGDASVFTAGLGEWSVGFSEFNLAGMKASDSVVLKFDAGTTWAYQGDVIPAFGNLALTEYVGNNVASVSDYGTSTSVGSIGSFQIESRAPGDQLSFDVTNLYNAAIARGDAAFGVRFNIPTGGTFWGGSLFGEANYNNMSLTVAAVPEASTWALMLGGLALIGFAKRRRVSGRGTQA